MSVFLEAVQLLNVHLKFISLDEEGNGQSESEERLPDLPLLSEQLLLDELWDMLGECLKELEESHDQHAVLGRWNFPEEMHFQLLCVTDVFMMEFN